MITYNETAKNYLLEYLEYRKKQFPNREYKRVFTTWHDVD